MITSVKVLCIVDKTKHTMFYTILFAVCAVFAKEM